MAHGQRIAFVVAVVFGVAMCVGVGMGKFSPKGEEIAAVAAPTVVVEAGTNLLAPQAVVWTQRVSFRRVQETVELDPRGFYNSMAGGPFHLLDTTSPAPAVSAERNPVAE
jgi:hypothetical protein